MFLLKLLILVVILTICLVLLGFRHSGVPHNNSYRQAVEELIVWWKDEPREALLGMTSIAGVVTIILLIGCWLL